MGKSLGLAGTQYLSYLLEDLFFSLSNSKTPSFQFLCVVPFVVSFAHNSAGKKLTKNHFKDNDAFAKEGICL